MIAYKEKLLDRHLHIICLNVPYPLNQEGAFELFYKLPALQKEGVKIHLHCFEYGRQRQEILNNYCEQVYYYPIEKGWKGFSVKLPNIVSTRAREDLLKNLGKDNYPILMEGIHCTYPLNDRRFFKRRIFVRLIHVEHTYYKHLASFANKWFNKLYFLWQSRMLKAYEISIANKAEFWSVIEKDREEYKKLGARKVTLIPEFLPFSKIKSLEGKGSFCLYHGDLTISENEKAATWLATHVFDNLDIPFVIAGKNPPKSLKKLMHNKKSNCLIPDPANSEMADLIAKAQIIIIPSFSSTGIKLTLFNSLFNGRHCLVNETTVEGTGLWEACYIANDAESFKNAIKTLYNQPFTVEDIIERRDLLEDLFDNEKTAKMMVKQIWQ